MLTEKVRLLEGVRYAGAVYKDVELRAPIIRDMLEAETECDGKSTISLALCLLSKRIMSIGTVPREKIDKELLADLCDEDFERLTTATEYLKKKAHWQPAD